MLFSSKYKDKINDLNNELNQLKKANQVLEAQLLAANTEKTQLHDSEVTNNTAYVKQRELNTLSLQSSDLIGEIRESLASTSHKLINDIASFKSSQELLDTILTMLATTSSSTHNISRDTKSASESVKELQSVTTGINDFVNIIKGISDQTNLLALNAAIEAARAGEQGRGFAVVADEVRTLAQRSSDASNEISNLIDKVNEQMQSVVTSITNVSEESDGIANSSSEIDTTAKKVVELSQNMYQVIINSSADAFIQTVKMDHIVWKYDIYKVILGQSTKTADDFSDHTMCRLGQWYYQGEGALKYSKINDFKALETPHEDVHKNGFAALAAYQSGDLSTAIEKISMMEQASFKVVDILSSLSHQIMKS
ncbi:methyl-accepting chemotaxis protein [Pseudoalteromonas sp.]|uniref:methyl-accepting chemotaxis protein n=1 Tax=Pseudoalteromonas sp. TaxID=53249 RepID=UPI001BCDE87A|nr:methyl-accepting chemotaxis protein [Pseudoalteromonas sp.]